MNTPAGPPHDVMASIELLRAMVDATSDFIVFKDTDLRYRSMNASFLQFIGKPEDEVIGKSDFDLFPNQEAEQFFTYGYQVLKTGEPRHREDYLGGATGAGWFQIDSIPKRRGDGTIEGVLVVMRDITQRRQAEESLRTQADRYATLLATSHDGFWAMNHRGELRDVNEAYSLMSGYTREELLKMRVSDVEAMETPEDTAQHIKDVFQNGFDRFESRHRKKDGTLIDVEVTASFWSETGEFLAFFRDITELRRAQEAIKAERQRFLSILDSLPIYLVLLTPDHHIAFANGIFRKRFGESDGRRCYEHLYGRTEPCSQCKTFNVLSTRNPLEWEWQGPDGRQYYVYDFPFTDIDGSTLILEAGLDFTELKQAEGALRQLNATLEQRVTDRTSALEAANRELESFSYSVSHDLRGPLRAINGYSQVLNEEYSEALSSSGKVYLQRIQSATLHMNKLIDGLLMLARVFRSDIAPANVDLSALAHEVVRQLGEERPGRLVLEIQPSIAATGDVTLLRLLLQNLFGNAMKFTARQPDPKITFGRLQRDDQAILFVRDNGIGFENEYAGKLFEPFSRLHAQEGFEGTGIGLATVRRIVQRHGGKVWAEGAVGQGATFYFTLPAVEG